MYFESQNLFFKRACCLILEKLKGMLGTFREDCCSRTLDFWGSISVLGRMGDTPLSSLFAAFVIANIGKQPEVSFWHMS